MSRGVKQPIRCRERGVKYFKNCVRDFFDYFIFVSDFVIFDFFCDFFLFLVIFLLFVSKESVQ